MSEYCAVNKLVCIVGAKFNVSSYGFELNINTI